MTMMTTTHASGFSEQNGKYDIDDGFTFNDLSKLIDNYRKNPITANVPSGKELEFTLNKVRLID